MSYQFPRVKTQIIPEFGTQSDYDAYLKTLTPKQATVSIAGTFAVNCAIVLGVSDAERAVFPADKIKLLEWIHEGYLSGEFVPKGEAAYFCQLAEHYAGGKPRPDQRTEVMKACFEHVFAIMKQERNLQGQPRTFVAGAGVLDAKRQKFLDDLSKVDDEPWEQP